jgi:hypothetical protein
MPTYRLSWIRDRASSLVDAETGISSSPLMSSGLAVASGRLAAPRHRGI